MEPTDPLAAIPTKWADPPKQWIQTVPKGGAQLEYLGHAAVTLVLLSIDPHYRLDWYRLEDGSAAISKQGDRLVVWGSLEVLGHTHSGVGTCRAGAPEPEKELLGDLLRNCAMRFGVGTGLWVKGDVPSAEPSRPVQQGERVEQAVQMARAVEASSKDTAVAFVRGAVKAKIDRLSDNHKAALRAWCASQGIPTTVAKMNETQLSDVEDWIEGGNRGE